MIPAFPIFKKIELEDKASVDFYTLQYKPYSDFNFTNLWAWDTKEGRMISQLNGNLVVRFTDYSTCEPLFSFLGTNETEKTAKELINYAKNAGVSDVLCYITEESAQALQSSDLFAEEDKGNFDYIFSIAQLVKPTGSKFKVKRHLTNRFVRDYPETSFELRNFNDSSVHPQIISVLRRWENKKKSDHKLYDLKNEEIALNRLLQTSNNHNLILSGVFLRDEMLGFSIDEVLPNNYAISHFIKADVSFKGIYEFMNEKVAQHLAACNAVLWNWEQDLNIEGLRILKMSYRPVNFLKKFKVSGNFKTIL